MKANAKLIDVLFRGLDALESYLDIISTEGKVKVTDFGIARAVSEHTIHSDVMGSVHYVSPEQARNGYVSNKSDIYSLGIVMY